MKYERKDGMLVRDDGIYIPHHSCTSSSGENSVFFAKEESLWERIKRVLSLQRKWFRSFDRKELLFDEATGMFEIAKGNPEEYRTKTRKPLSDYSIGPTQTTLSSFKYLHGEQNGI